MEKSKSPVSSESIRMQESADSLLVEAMKLPGVADYFAVYGEYQKLEGRIKAYLASLRPVVSWNSSDTTAL